jgi:hypothetical protein
VRIVYLINRAINKNGVTGETPTIGDVFSGTAARGGHARARAAKKPVLAGIPTSGTMMTSRLQRW